MALDCVVAAAATRLMTRGPLFLVHIAVLLCAREPSNRDFPSQPDHEGGARKFTGPRRRSPSLAANRVEAGKCEWRVPVPTRIGPVHDR